MAEFTRELTVVLGLAVEGAAQLDAVRKDFVDIQTAAGKPIVSTLEIGGKVGSIGRQVEKFIQDIRTLDDVATKAELAGPRIAASLKAAESQIKKFAGLRGILVQFRQEFEKLTGTKTGLSKFKQSEAQKKSFETFLTQFSSELTGGRLGAKRETLDEGLQERLKLIRQFGSKGLNFGNELTPDVLKKVDVGIADIDKTVELLSRDMLMTAGRAEQLTGGLAAQGKTMQAEIPKVKELRQELEKLRLQNTQLQQGIAKSAKKPGFRGFIASQGGGLKGLIAAQILSFGRLALFANASVIIFGIFSAIRSGIKSAIDFQKIIADIQGVLPSKDINEAFLIGDTVLEKAAQFGVSIREAAESAKIFAQTGQNAQQIAESLTATLFAVRGANLGLEQARELIIAIENISKGEVTAASILDRISRVESRRAVTAIDLANSIQRLGPLVTQLKGDMTGLVDEFDIAMATVTTIVESTRVSGLNASTSLRFILSRLGRPQILTQIQQLTGVGLARPGGTELRPFVEILQEVSVAYQKLIDTDKSAKAFQLLSVIGGARQLQATATILQNFAEETLPTAREASLAFGDTAERTSIAMDTMKVKAQKVGTAWSRMITTFGRSRVISGTLEGALSGVSAFLNTAAQVTEKGNDLEEFLLGGPPKRINFIQQGDVDTSQLPLVVKFREAALGANLTVDELLGKLGELSIAIAEDVEGISDRSLTQLILDLDKGADGDSFRGLSNLIGTDLAEGLSGVIDKFTEYQKVLDSVSSTPSEKAAASAGRIADALNLLGQATFVSSAVFQSDLNKVIEGLKSVSGQISSIVAESLKDLSDVNIKDLGGKTVANVTSALFKSIFVKSLPSDLQIVTENLLSSTEATEAWAQAIQDVIAKSKELGTTVSASDVFDRFATIAQNSEGVFSALQKSIEDGLLQFLDEQNLIPERFQIGKDAEGATVSLLLSKLLKGAEEGALARSGLSGDARTAASKAIQDLTDIESSAFAKLAESLNTLDKGFVKVRQFLSESLVKFISASDATRQLDDAYSQLGITFNANNKRVQNTSTFLNELLGIQGKLRSEIVLTDIELQSFTRQANAIITQGLPAEGLKNALGEIVAQSISEQLQGKDARALENRKATILSLQSSLAQLGSGDKLTDILGDTPQAKQFLTLFSIVLKEINIDSEGALLNFVALVEAAKLLFRQATIDLQVQQRRKIVLEEQGAALKSQLGIEKKLRDSRLERVRESERSRFETTQQFLGIAGRPGDVLQSQIEQQVALREKEAVIIKQSFDTQLLGASKIQAKAIETALVNEGLLSAQPKLFALGASFQLEINEILAERNLLIEDLNDSNTKALKQIQDKAVLAAFASLSQQVQQNVDSATAGIRTLLTDVEALKSSPIRTILTPIGETFIKRAAENFTSELFRASSDTFFGKLANAFGSSPEVRLRRELESALNLGGLNIANQFRAAGNDVALQLAVVLRAVAPGQTITEVPTPTEIPEAAKGELGKQLALLIGAQVGALLGGTIGGNQQNASLGAQLGGIGGTLSGIPGGGPIGALIGGLIGGLIGPDDEDDKKKTIQALSKIETNTRRSADILELENRFINIARGAVNVPSAFNLPAFTPGTGGGTVIQQTNTIQATITIEAVENPQLVVEVIRSELGPMLTDELRKLGA